MLTGKLKNEIILRRKRSKRGAALLIALFLTLCLTMMIVGTQLAVVQQLSASHAERDYERALMMAEAGINAYVNGLTNGVASGSNAAYIPTSYNFSTSTLGRAPTCAEFLAGVISGTYTVTKYPANSQQGYFVGYVPATGSAVTISSYGWSHGVVRRVNILATPNAPSNSSSYAIFGGTTGQFNGSSTINGSLGTNGNIYLYGSNVITGSVVLNGSSAKLTQSGSNSYTTLVNNTTPITWPTVETLANQAVSGGLTKLATTNDNALSHISGNSLVLNGSGTFTFNSKAGGANYYLTLLQVNGSYNLYFNNTLGPINIWIGPSGGSGTVSLNGSSYAVSMSTDPTKAARIYDAASGQIQLNGSSVLNVGIYDINNAGTGTVLLNGSAAINTSIITTSLQANGSSTVNYTSGYFTAPGATVTYTCSNWSELY